ncbi:hypothetical protein Acsp07_02590 [Actinomycetospora sp. NBRC 106378]|nr:hypothetical protein Acsp07_02590 [Actinomycetospora sp. NBRC 106378]
MTGYPLGGVVCALLGILMVPAFGWRSIFVVGAAPAVVLVPLMIRYLPRAAPVIEATNIRIEEHDHPDRDALAGLFRGRGLRATLAFWVASFMGLMLIYGLNTWLPQIMSAAGYSLGNSLGFLLTLNLGAIIGQFLGGWLADRRGARLANISWFGGAAVFLAMFALPLPNVFLYVPLFLAGIFTFSSQSLTYAYTQRFYPEHLRAAGVGWAAGVGRVGAMCGPLLGGALLTIGVAYPWGFYIFALAGALGALATWLVPKAYASTPKRKADRQRALEASE